MHVQRQNKYNQGAEGWLKDTKCNLEMFLDQDRSLYRTFGLPRSVSKVWKVKVMTFPSKKFSWPKRQPIVNPIQSKRRPSKVWGMSTIHFYAGEVASGRSLPKSQEEEDDPLQMGGDFTLNRWWWACGMWIQIQRSYKCNLHHFFCQWWRLVGI